MTSELTPEKEKLLLKTFFEIAGRHAPNGDEETFLKHLQIIKFEMMPVLYEFDVTEAEFLDIWERNRVRTLRKRRLKKWLIWTICLCIVGYFVGKLIASLI